MQNKLKIAFCGGGIDSAVGRAHQIAVKIDNKFELAAGCFSLDAEINQVTARDYAVAPNRIYKDLAELITKEKDNIDAVVILTPTPDHQEAVLKCLSQKIPVICEKALAVSSAGALEIAEMVDNQRGFLAAVYNYTGYPMLRELKELIASGKLGKIEQIHIEMPQEGFIKTGTDGRPVVPQDWRLHDTALPVVSLDLGVHIHQIVDFLTGEKPLEVAAVQNHFGFFKQIVDDVSCIVNYTNNLFCSFWYGKTAVGQRNGLRVRVFGQKAAAEWYQLNPEEMVFCEADGKRETLDRASPGLAVANQARYSRFKAGHPAGYIEAFANHYADIAVSLRSYLETGNIDFGKYVFGADTALEGLRFLNAIHKAAVSKKWEVVK